MALGCLHSPTSSSSGPVRGSMAIIGYMLFFGLDKQERDSCEVYTHTYVYTRQQHNPPHTHLPLQEQLLLAVPLRDTHTAVVDLDVANLVLPGVRHLRRQTKQQKRKKVQKTRSQTEVAQGLAD